MTKNVGWWPAGGSKIESTRKKTNMKAHVIMLISADPAARGVVEKAVLAARRGLRVVADRERALRELSSVEPDMDMVIIDFDSGINGLNLFVAARDRFPVLVLTHRDATDLQRILRRHGAVGSLTKPLAADELQKAIRELLEPAAMAA